jgi:rhodanese-related sulfurtransferase
MPEPGGIRRGHIGNAFNLPGLRFEAHFAKVASVLSSDSQIIVYCDGTECDLSHRVSERLEQMGFFNVRILTNGWSTWRQAGLPTKKRDVTIEVGE